MQYYRLKYRLSMQHSFDNKIEHKHNHVIEIQTISRSRNDVEVFTEFQHMERAMNDVIDRYQNKYLNELPEFEGDTTMEHIGEVIYKKMNAYYEEKNWILARFEISETPLRVYAIVAEEY